METAIYYLPKNLSGDFKVIYILRKNAVLNDKKINNIFLKFHYYLLRTPKIV